MRVVRHRHYANDWQMWFAWYPVRIAIAEGSVWVWWEHVYRRTLCMGWRDGIDSWYEYAPPEQVRAERCA